MARTEWWYDWPETEDGTSYWALRVDEDSSNDELETEIEYWMNQIRDYEVDGVHKKSLMAAIKWMTTLMS